LRLENPYADLAREIPPCLQNIVVTLRRGFGRLIRSLEDRGVLVLLDPHVRRQRYGQTLLASLPPYRMTQTITDVEKSFRHD